MPSYVLTLLHFNLQYCAGGLDGLYTTWPTDAESVEDQIIDQSFTPVLDVLDAHPTWTFDIELQAYMVEVLAERRPDVLDHLRTLADNGQVELVSFHYSDQLWTAYPWRDEEVSLALTRDVFDANQLRLSDVVWSQEGQFGQGMLERMPQEGYAIAVMPHNLAEFAWGTSPDAPVYSYEADAGDVIVLPGGSGFAGNDFSVGWSFLDDGELWATGGLDPYLGPAFLYDADSTAARVAELEAAEEAGALIVGVHDYVAAVVGTPLGTPAPLPPVIDGTWQPDDTTNMFRWMGGSGLWGEDEHDDPVLTTNMRARHVVEAAEIAGGDPDLVEQAWRALLLGEVSDATGWNPYPTEPQYALDHAAEAERLALESLASQCGDALLVDLDAGALVDASPADSAIAASAPLDVTAAGRSTDTTWLEVVRSTDGVREYQAEVLFGAGEDPLELTFPWDGEQIATVPALLDEVVAVDASTVGDPVGIALSSGLLRLSDRAWLVQDTATTHLAAVLSRSGASCTFADQTVPADEPARWVYRVFIGDESVTDDDVRVAALAEARRLNLAPVVTLDLAACDTAPLDEGCVPGVCCCAALGGPTSLYAVAPLAFLLAQRRRPVSRQP